MPTNETPDPAVAEADRRAERAKASLLSRVDALKHKLGDARHKLDVGARIAQHPLPAVGLALALGALAGLGGSRRSASASTGERSLTGAALGALAAVGLRIVRELAMGQLGHLAKEWLVEHGGAAASKAEPRTSRMAEVEPFLEH
jgi:hypothetical protein